MNRFKLDPNFVWMVKINSMMVSPDQVNRIQKSDYNRLNQENRVVKKLIFNNMIGGIIMLLVYGLCFGFFDYKSTPIIYDVVVAIFFSTAVLQSIVYFHNVLFESRDVGLYKTLPVKESHIIGAKLVSVAMSLYVVIMPVLVVSIIRGFRFGLGWWSIVFGLADFIVIFVLSMLVGLAISSFVAGMPVRKKWRNVFMNIVNALNIAINVAIVMSVQYVFKDMIEKMLRSSNTIFGPISSLMVSNVSHVVLLGGLLIFSLLVYNPLIKKVEKSIENYTNPIKVDKIKSVKKNKESNSSSVNRELIRVNIGKITDSNILMQNVLSSLLPILFIMGSMFNTYKELHLNTGNIKLNFVFGLAISLAMGVVVCSCPTNLFSIVVSIDREDYTYMKALPISRKSYYIDKFIAALLIQLPFILLAMIGIEIMLGIKPVFILLSCINLIIVSSPIFAMWIKFDRDNLNTKWQNITELNSRMGGVNAFMLMFLSLIISMGILTVASIFYDDMSYITVILIWIVIIFSLYLVSFTKTGILKILDK